MIVGDNSWLAMSWLVLNLMLSDSGRTEIGHNSIAHQTTSHPVNQRTGFETAFLSSLVSLRNK